MWRSGLKTWVGICILQSSWFILEYWILYFVMLHGSGYSFRYLKFTRIVILWIYWKSWSSFFAIFHMNITSPSICFNFCHFYLSISRRVANLVTYNATRINQLLLRPDFMSLAWCTFSTCANAEIPHFIICTCTEWQKAFKPVTKSLQSHGSYTLPVRIGICQSTLIFTSW